MSNTDSEILRVVNIENRGRPPANKDIQHSKAAQAWRAYRRLINRAKDPELQRENPRLVTEIDKWLYEIQHGKAAISIDQRIQSVNVTISGEELTRRQAIRDGLLSLPELPTQEADLIQLPSETMADSEQIDNEE